MSSGHPSTTLTGSAGAHRCGVVDLGAGGVGQPSLIITHVPQKRNGMMEPDDFRACLISMGYDLVSAPSLCRGSPISASLLQRDHLLCPSYLHMRFILSMPTEAGQNDPTSHRGCQRLR